MSNKQQTAVEWLYSELFNHIDMPSKHKQELIEQAKEMEKQQIMDAFNEGLVEKKPDDYLGCQKSAEQYYKETFKSE